MLPKILVAAHGTQKEYSRVPLPGGWVNFVRLEKELRRTVIYRDLNENGAEPTDAHSA